ncbi:MAG: amino acid ABC transporter substrate-binding protein [Alcaligenaceae bacterium]|nr:amino acid ABC transporter substrate-binding protein [Alcaligenaceae bacterium]
MEFSKSRRRSLMGLAAGLTSVYALPSRTFADDKKPITIGGAIAQTGPLAAGGKSALLSLQLWQDDINSQGGLLGRPVKLVIYDDQGVPANEPQIYTKLMEVDRVDLLISPYGTNPTAAVLRLLQQRKRLVISNFAFAANNKIKYDRYFQIAPWGGDTDGWVGAFINPGLELGAKKLAILAANTEFSQTLADGARKMAKEKGLEIVYDQSYPASTVDFSSMLPAMNAKSPDLVFVASYPSDSAAIVRAVHEIGVADSVQMIGGAMIGLQYASLMTSLGPSLNGFVNNANYVPSSTLKFAGVKDFFERYGKAATEQDIDPLGYWLAPFNYAIGQVFAQAVTETGGLDDEKLAQYLHTHTLHTIVGDINFTKIGEWAKPRVFEMQFQGIDGNGIDQFRDPKKQIIFYPQDFKSGDLRAPFNQAWK